MARRVYVTGTNGKTSTTTMLAAIAAAAGDVDARVTTLGTVVGGEMVAEAPTLEAFVALLEASQGARGVFVETSSHALAEGFAHRFPPDVGVFTNLTRDHLDYHQTFEHYLASKAQLFVNLTAGGLAVLNAADASSALIDEVTPAGVTRAAYAARPVVAACARLPLVLSAARVNLSRTGTRVRLAAGRLADAMGGEIALKVLGDVQAENALAAAVAADGLGFSGEEIRRGLEAFSGVPGRFEVVREAPLVVVDYAHTPAALDRALALARVLARQGAGRVVCVFGCGGDRDPGKRGPMGRVASEVADVAIVTTDNPRGEDPGAIADAIIEGAASAPRRRATIERIADRAAAIRRGVTSAQASDVVVIAGKGHETTQVVGESTLPFDDAAVARASR